VNEETLLFFYSFIQESGLFADYKTIVMEDTHKQQDDKKQGGGFGFILLIKGVVMAVLIAVKLLL